MEIDNQLKIHHSSFIIHHSSFIVKKLSSDGRIVLEGYAVADVGARVDGGPAGAVVEAAAADGYNTTFNRLHFVGLQGAYFGFAFQLVECKFFFCHGFARILKVYDPVGLLID